MPDIHRVKTIDVLRWIDRGHHPSSIDIARQRQLDEDAVDLVVTVEPGDQFEDTGFAAISRQAVFERGDPGLGTGAGLAANIKLARWVVADQDRGEAGRDPMAA